MKEFTYTIKTEHIQALLEGKKLIIDEYKNPRITLIPDRYGVFLTMEKFAELRKKIMMTAITQNPEETLREVFGEDLFEKYIKNK